MPKNFDVECTGPNPDSPIEKVKDKIIFTTKGSCKFTSFVFLKWNGQPYPQGILPPGFSNQQPANGAGKKISFDYEGTGVPVKGRRFIYSTDSPLLGNGTGTIKNM